MYVFCNIDYTFILLALGGDLLVQNGKVLYILCVFDIIKKCFGTLNLWFHIFQINNILGLMDGTQLHFYTDTREKIHNHSHKQLTKVKCSLTENSGIRMREKRVEPVWRVTWAFCDGWLTAPAKRWGSFSNWLPTSPFTKKDDAFKEMGMGMIDSDNIACLAAYTYTFLYHHQYIYLYLLTNWIVNSLK